MLVRLHSSLEKAEIANRLCCTLLQNKPLILGQVAQRPLVLFGRSKMSFKRAWLKLVTKTLTFFTMAHPLRRACRTTGI